jgi:antitoxin FitA
MAQILVRNLSEEAKERLKQRAARRGRSLEAEARDVLEMGSFEPAEPRVLPSKNESFGAQMSKRFGARGLTPKEYGRFELAEGELRDHSMLRIPDFDE